MTGGVIASISLGLFASLVSVAGEDIAWGEESMFWTLAGVAIAAGVGTISSRNPVYCALWFALSVLATAGLMLFQGSQFLGVATVVVYAGAIVVTFLFVLMLAQSDGRAAYDRTGWGRAPALASCAAGAVMVGVLTFALASGSSVTATDSSSAGPEVLAEQHHVASFGGQLFTRQLVAVEVAGLLLLVALIGAAAIVAHGRQVASRGEDSEQ